MHNFKSLFFYILIYYYDIFLRFEKYKLLIYKIESLRKFVHNGFISTISNKIMHLYVKNYFYNIIYSIYIFFICFYRIL